VALATNRAEHRETKVELDQIVARLTEASDAELSEALGHIGELAAAIKDDTSKDATDRLVSYAGIAKQVKAEQASRAALAAERTAALAELTPAAGELAAAQPTGGPDGDPVDGDTDQDKSEARGEKTKPTSTKPTGETVTAAGAPAPLGSIGKQGDAPKPTGLTAGAITVKTVVNGNVPGHATGEQLTDRVELAEAFANKMNTINGRGQGADGRHDVIRFNYTYPEDRQLDRAATWSENTRKIEAGQDPKAIVAAGGFCAPLEILYDIDTIGITDRPVMAALNRYQVERGGIQYRPPFDALGSDVLGESGHTGGLGIWTATDDADVSSTDDTTWKGCAVVECPGLEMASVYSTYLCLEFPNFTSRFDPEWADATMQAALIAAARFQENQLLTRILNGSTDASQTGDVGSKMLFGPNSTINGTDGAVSSARDVLVTLDRAVAYYRNRHRLDSMVPLTFILPRWVRELFRSDLCRGFSYDLDALAIADSLIDGWFATRGVTPVWHLDGLAATQVGGSTGPTVVQQFYNNATAGTAVPEYPTQLDTALFATGDWLYLDGGVLDLGLVRDSQLNARNRYRTFTESFEGVAFRGIESLRLVIQTGVPTGATVGTIAKSQITS
jgi:hypothetical protein